MLLDYALALAGLACGFWLLWRIPVCRVATREDSEGASDVSVIIPARNEASRLPNLLNSLADQTVRPAQLIVVDDGSTDATADVARSLGATVISPGALPTGWAGKPWACWNGALQATAQRMVFLDADVVLRPDGLARLVQEHRMRGGLLTVQPYHSVVRAYEQLSAWFNLVVMMGTGSFTPLGSRVQPKGAFGPCMVCRRDEYFMAGGHKAAADEVLEDIEVGRAFQRSGYAVHCLGGRGVVSFRMYPDGLGSLIEGWSKGFAIGASRVGPVTAIPVALWVTGCFGAFSDPLQHLLVGSYGSSWVSAVAPAVVYLAYAGQLRWMLGRVGTFRWWTWACFPLPLMFFVGLFLRSFWLTFVLKRVTWRGRVVRLRKEAVEDERVVT